MPLHQSKQHFNPSCCSFSSPIDQFQSLSLPHSSRQLLLVVFFCMTTCAGVTNSNELKFGYDARAIQTVFLGTTRDYGLRRERSASTAVASCELDMHLKRYAAWV